MRKRRPKLSYDERRAFYLGYIEQKERGLNYRELEKWARDEFDIGASTLYKYRKEFQPKEKQPKKKEKQRPAVMPNIGRLKGVTLG